MADVDLSLQYHSIRIYDGTYETRDIPYRIGNRSTTISEQIEHYYDTWDNFHLIPAARPTVALPKGNSKLIAIPGSLELIDFSNWLTGHPTYANRTGQWSFYTDPDYVDRYLGGWVAFDKILRSLFHGHISKVVLRDDPSYFYAGELAVGQWAPGADRSTITISYNFYPYKKALLSSMELWPFDDFDFTDGIVSYMKDMEVDGSRIVTVYGSTERISPHISGSSGLFVDKYENNTWVSYGSVPTGDITGPQTIIPRLVIGNGPNRLRFRGNGTVTIDYRRGLL